MATRWEPGLVEAFGELVEVLSKMDRGEAKALVTEAGLRSQNVFYKENIDLRQMVRRIRGLAEGEELRSAAVRFLEIQEAALVSETALKPGTEGLSGMTIWCPVYGDQERVGRYYSELEFHRVTGWGDVVECGLDPERFW